MSDEHVPPLDDDKADGERNEIDLIENDGSGDGEEDSNGDEMDGNDENNGGDGNGSEEHVDNDDSDEDDEFQEWFADSDSMDFYEDEDEDDFFPEDDDDFFHDDDDEYDSDQLDNQDDNEDSGPPIYFLPGGGVEFLSALWATTQEEGFTDTEVTFEDGQKMQLNRVVLASLSEYFKNMLSTQMREALEGKISLPTVSLKNFKRVLAFSLGQRQELESREEVLDLLELADMWQMQDLLHKCLRQLKENLSADNALDTYFYLDQHNYSEMKMEVREYIQTHFRKIRQSEDFKHLSEGELLPLLDVSGANYLCNESLEAALEWLEANNADPSLVVRVLDAAVVSNLSEYIVNKRLIGNPMVWLNEEARMLVCRKLAPKYNVCLLAFGHELRESRSQSTICAWKELPQEWGSLEPQHRMKLFPARSSLAADEHRVYITGGELENKPVDSVMVFRPTSVNVSFGGSFSFNGYSLKTARMQHGSAVVRKMLCVAGGLPGPMSSVEMCSCETLGSWRSVGNLPVGVCFCSAGVVESTLVVAGYRTANLEQHIIQTFNIETQAAQIITLDMGRDHHILPLGNLGGLRCLSSDGSLLELGWGDSGALEVKSQTQLQNFGVQAPFVAFFDGRKLVVVDSASSPVRVERYGVDGKKEDAASPFYQFPALTDVVGLTWSVIKAE